MAKKTAVWGIDIGQCALKAMRCTLDGDDVVAQGVAADPCAVIGKRGPVVGQGRLGRSDRVFNRHAGGKIERAVVDDQMLELVEIVRPKLVQD